MKLQGNEPLTNPAAISRRPSQCGKCGVVKPFESYYQLPNGKRRGRTCKECHRADMRAYHAENRKQENARRAAYYQANKEREAERQRRWKRGYRATKKRLNPPARIQVPAHPGYVYLIREKHGAVKIGTSINPKRRLEDLRATVPYSLQLLTVIKTDARFHLESVLHERYRDKRINGEWFALGPEDIRAVIELKESGKARYLATENGEAGTP